MFLHRGLTSWSHIRPCIRPYVFLVSVLYLQTLALAAGPCEEGPAPPANPGSA